MASQGSKLMDKGETIKRKRIMTLSQKEAKSPNKKKSYDFSMQVRSSQDLLKLYAIKREKVAAERKKDDTQDKALETQKRKQHMLTMKDVTEAQSKIVLNKKMIQPMSSSQSHDSQNTQKTISTTQGVEKRKIAMKKTMTRDEVSNQNQMQQNVTCMETMDRPRFTCTKDQENLKKAKQAPVCPSMGVGLFLEKQGVQVEEHEQHEDVSDDLDEEERNDMPLDPNEDAIMDELADIDPNNFDNDTTEKIRKTRGRTTCTKIHARTMEERVEITFDKGQAVGPTPEKVSELSSFLGTIARNTSFVTLLYTSWRGVPDENKKRMWDYVNTKFIIPEDGERWIMSGICDAWKRYKGKIKKMHFDKYASKEDMMVNRPTHIPEVQFTQLINYWSLPVVQEASQKNSENRKKQKCGHRMGTTNFGIVRTELRAKKENNEEPTKSEMFIATRTSRKGKEVDLETQAAISELQNRQTAGENDEDALEAVLGKENHGRVRCYGRSITKTYLKRDEEIRQIKQQHDDKVKSLENNLTQRMDGLCNLIKVLVQQNNPGMNAEDIAALIQAAQQPLHDANSAQIVAKRNCPHSSGSSHIPNYANDDMLGALDGDDDDDC